MAKQTAIQKQNGDYDKELAVELMNLKGGTFSLTGAEGAQKLEELAKRGYRFEKVWKPMGPNDGIEGVFLGEGSPLEGTNALGEAFKLRTFRVQTGPGIVRRVIGDYQVEHELAQAIAEGKTNQPCVLIFLGQVETRKGTRANDWAIAVGAGAIEEMKS